MRGSVKERTIQIPRPIIKEITLHIEGASPLICHNAQSWIDAELSKALPPAQRPPRDPEAKFKASLYVLDNGRYGFPSEGFMGSLLTATGRFQDWKSTGLTSKKVAGWIQNRSPEWVELRGSEPRMRQDRVVLANGSPDITWRGEFWPWETELTVGYSQPLTVDHVAALFTLAGDFVGVGDWRPGAPKRGGRFGRYKLLTVEEVVAPKA